MAAQPSFLDTATPYIGAASLFASTLGMMSSANAAKAAAESNILNLQFKADMAKVNAQLAEINAQGVLLQTDNQIRGIKLRAGKVKSAQKVSMAANGIAMTGDETETANNVLTSTDLMAELDVNQAFANGVRGAWGYRTQATSLMGEAAVASASAKTIDPDYAYNSSMLTGASQVGMNWYYMSKGTGLYASR